MVFPRTAAKVNFTSSTQHLLLAFHHVHHLHQLHLHHIRRLYLLHLSYIPYITYIIYINFIYITYAIYIIYSNFMCITYTICITNTSYRCSSCTCALQNSYNVIYSAPGSYTGVVTQELLHRSCYTGVVTKELLHRSAQVHLNAYKTPTGTSQALLNFSFLAAGAARPRPPKRDSLWRSSDSRTHKRVVRCLFFGAGATLCGDRGCRMHEHVVKCGLSAGLSCSWAALEFQTRNFTSVFGMQPLFPANRLQLKFHNCVVTPILAMYA